MSTTSISSFRGAVFVSAFSILAVALANAIDDAQENAAGPSPDESLEFAVRPRLQYQGPDSARVSWQATHAGSGALAYGKTRKLGTVLRSPSQGRSHEVTLSGLEPATVYYYRFGAMKDGKRLFSRIYEFDTTLNYSVPAVAASSGSAAAAAGKRAKSLLEVSRVRDGYCLVIGLEDGELAQALANQSHLVIVGVDDDAEKIAALRSAFYRRGVYGPRLSFRHVESLGALPFTDHFANLIVSERSGTGEEEIFRLLRPQGGMAVFAKDSALGESLNRLPVQAHIKEEGGFIVARRGVIPGAGQWTHQYGDAANTTDSRDALLGADGTDDLEIQWVGRPGADFGIDRNPRMPAPLSVNGRLFHQGMNRMIALDAYNGAVLWALEIPDLRRVNIPRDSSNWCADDDHVYVVVKDRAWVLDAATGRTTRHFRPAGAVEDGSEWGYIAQIEDLVLGSRVKKDSPYTAFWSGASWYDGKDAAATAKVCSESLFAYSKTTGDVRWHYENGVIINTTISADGEAVYFAECRHPEMRKLETGRIASDALFEDLFAVCLDVRTGRKRWEQPLKVKKGGVITFYGLVTPEALVFIASSAGRYHFHTFEPGTGRPLWERSNKWLEDHHSGHIQHPVAMQGRLYLQPYGMKLTTGEVFTDKMGRREGCHTYVGARDALIFRGTQRQISMWSLESEKTTHWTRLRPSCWLSVIPSGGMLLVPEGGGGCSCGGWMETSLAFRPRQGGGKDVQN